jgi:hypothetical protein
VTDSAPAPDSAGGRSRETLWLALAIVAWSAAIGMGWWTLSSYEFSREPSPRAAANVVHWPANSNLMRAAGRPTVLFFVHPRCPCTRASLAEMERAWVLDQKGTEQSPQLIVVATVPENGSEDWTTTATIERARTLPGAQIVMDRGGIEAERFGVVTSGTVMWFDAAGHRLYAGGVTASRGHEGDNAGRDALAQLLRGSQTPGRGLPAFGCRLCLPEPSGPTANRSLEGRILEQANGGEP